MFSCHHISISTKASPPGTFSKEDLVAVGVGARLAALTVLTAHPSKVGWESKEASLHRVEVG